MWSICGCKNKEKVNVLDRLYKQGVNRNIYMEYVDKEQMRKEELHLRVKACRLLIQLLFSIGSLSCISGRGTIE